MKELIENQIKKYEDRSLSTPRLLQHGRPAFG
jgi:hypothetical protein